MLGTVTGRQFSSNNIKKKNFKQISYRLLKDGMSALAWASKEGYEDIVVKLIDKGAFLNVPDNVSTN